MAKRRFPKDAKYAPNKILAHLWMRQRGKRRIRRLERQTAKAQIRKVKDD